jgi:addiction module HigA family antidote
MTSHPKRRPTSPGEILAEEFLRPLGMTQRELATHIGHDVKVINRIVNGRSSITAEMALKLASALGTSPDFWLNAQKAVDLYEARMALGKLPGLLRAAE